MGSDIGLIEEFRRRHNRWFGAGLADVRLGGSDIFSVHAQVAFGSCDRFGKVFANKGRGKSRPRCKEASIDSLRPSFDDRAETCAMEVLHKVWECLHCLCAVY
jgi:hypothetical protein